MQSLDPARARNAFPADRGERTECRSNLGIRARQLAILWSFVLFITATAHGQTNVHVQWQSLPTTMPINPVHANLLRTGKILVVAGSGNVPGNNSFQAGVW